MRCGLCYSGMDRLPEVDVPASTSTTSPQRNRVLDRIPAMTPRTPAGVPTAWTTACTGRPDPGTGAETLVNIVSDRPGCGRNAPARLPAIAKRVPDTGYSTGPTAHVIHTLPSEADTG